MAKSLEMNMAFLEAARKHFGETAKVKAKDLFTFAEENGFRYPGVWLRENFLVTRGIFALDGSTAGAPKPEKSLKDTDPVTPPTDAQPNAVAQVLPFPSQPRAPKPSSVVFDPNAVSDHAYAAVPAKDSNYVPFGDYKMIEQVLASGIFFPIFVAGLSGNGKTMLIEQSAARTKRALIRTQCTTETDEDDIIGGFRLINGETKFIKGPAVRAMELGCVLLVDEVDRADPNKIMCLQGILEGKPYYMKKTGEIIYPRPGFNICVTANTKGRGSDNGLYTAAKILDDSWLERFVVTIEQQWPSPSVERHILRNVAKNDPEMDDFISHLVNWGQVVRKTFDDNAIEEVISTRRLIHVLRTFLLFRDRLDAVRYCVARYNENTKTALLELYSKVDASVNPDVPLPLEVNASVNPDVPLPLDQNSNTAQQTTVSSRAAEFMTDGSLFSGADETEREA